MARTGASRQAGQLPAAGPDVGGLLEELRRSGLRLTAARQFVVEVLAAAEGHLPVDRIHAEVSQRSPAVNLSTVHRTLATLLDEQVVHAVPTRRGLTYGLAHGHRHHTLCRECGRTAEIGDQAVDVAALPAGFRAEAVIVYGRCAACG